EKMPPARLDTSKMQFLYESDGQYTFMDVETYEQIELNKDQLGNALNFLMENMEVNLQTFKGRIIGVNLPNSVELRVTECEPAVKGNTATGATKNATLETGYVVRVPLFINEGDLLRIDTRTGNYIERA
ncbi:MAG: elongation factor P, partial [Selenomonadaceae bacterium]|nr:elongation factor P [Selenomonadaceae bacterium]